MTSADFVARRSTRGSSTPRTEHLLSQRLPQDRPQHLRRMRIDPRATPAADEHVSSPADATAKDRTVDEPAATRRDPLRVAARLSPLLGLLASILLVVWGMQTGVLRSLENLQAYMDSLGAWGAIMFLLVSTAAVVFPVIPGGLLVVAGPVLFGPLEGTLYNYIAVCTGSFLNFAIARHVGMALIERLFSPRLVDKYLGWTRSPNFTRAFAVAIALPVAPDDLLCYLAGTTRMTWRTYALVILLCKPWALVAYGLGVSALIMRVLPW